jgi:hypothetical protein
MGVVVLNRDESHLHVLKLRTVAMLLLAEGATRLVTQRTRFTEYSTVLPANISRADPGHVSEDKTARLLLFSTIGW